MVLYANNTPMNITIYPGGPASVVNQSPSPWYVQYLPEFIIAAGIIVTALTFYFSPELRSIIKRATFKLK